MEFAIVGLVVSNIIVSLICWRFYTENVLLIESALKNECYQARLTNEIDEYKESLRKCHSARKAEVYELQDKLDRIQVVFKPETLINEFIKPYDTQDFHVADILARHE
jgi:hypothetical protein